MPRYNWAKILATTLSLITPLVAISTMAAIAFPQTPHKIISIAEARTLPLGTVVTVEGSVTVPSGAFKSSSNDEGFVIQDMSGGTYISVHSNLNLTVGQRVRVTGKLAETNAQFQIVEAEASSIKVRGRGPVVKPKPIATGRVNQESLGQLVKATALINNPIVRIGPSGFRLPINDGSGENVSYVSASTGIAQQNSQQGQRISGDGHRRAIQRAMPDPSALSRRHQAVTKATVREAVYEDRWMSRPKMFGQSPCC